MARFEKGLVYTNDKCTGCNRCVSQCSILGTNISRLKNKRMRIIIDSKKCVHCGKCINECLHNARDYTDDTDLFFKALSLGIKFSLVIDSSFYELYGKKAYNILGYLKSLGVEKIYNSAFGMEISIWCHIKYLKEHLNDPADTKAFIAQNCSALVNMITMYYPYLRRRIIPVQSAAMCTAIYAKKYLHDENEIIFLGPCISKKDDFNQPDKQGIVNYNMTYNHFMKNIENIDISNFYAEAELNPIGLGNITEWSGGLKEVISYFFPRGENLVFFENINNEAFTILNKFVRSKKNEVQPLLADASYCVGGCSRGPGIEQDKFDTAEVHMRQAELYHKAFESFPHAFDYEQNWKDLQKRFENLNSEDFSRTFEDKFRQPFVIPESTFDEIFNTMLKFTPESRNINCGSCGYKSCKDMATAIAYAYSKKENCIWYMNEEMQKRLYTDSETGLPNKAYFMKNVPKILENNPNKDYLICSGDVNRFKIINDLYGAKCGDSVLRIIAEELKNIAEPDGLCARFSGNHFVICMEYNVDTMQKLRSFKQFDCKELGISFPVTMRFGIYITEHIPEEKTIPFIVNCANLAMDKATSTIVNTYNFFTKDLRETLFIEASTSALMPPALENNEFQLWFQPQFDASTKELKGAEALCRWLRPDGSLIPPSFFIPIAEKNGFIIFLDTAIWRMAFAAVKRWIDAGIKTVPVSVNISRETLSSDSFFYTINRLKDEFQIPQDSIHFEITESAYIDEQGKFLERIEKIKSLGFKIAMDDFGSGYSSLNSLKNIDIDYLKLDMGFLDTNQNENRARCIISSVINMAKQLNVITIAEGVETYSQADFLQKEGCDLIQGFFYSKPLPEHRFIELINDQESFSKNNN
ncbi:MAG: EAL domain-containing protein [Treponema sp.]|nr:EAL domain-containing protein [Treponema sp.]